MESISFLDIPDEDRVLLNSIKDPNIQKLYIDSQMDFKYLPIPIIYQQNDILSNNNQKIA